MKLTEFTTPTGAKGNVLHPSTWLSMILGVLVFLITLGLGQHLFQRATSRFPQTSIGPFVNQPAPVSSGASRQAFTG